MKFDIQYTRPLVSMHWEEVYRNPDKSAHRQIQGRVSFAGPFQIVLTLVVVCFFFLLNASSSLAGNRLLTASEASAYIGQKMMLCGHLVSSQYVDNIKEQPTFLHFDEPYPRHIFTVVIFDDYRSAFGGSETTYKEKDMYVS